MDQRISRLALYASVALGLLGLVILYLGYDGTATEPQLVRQIPYLVSGGFAGLALLFMSSTAMLISVMIRLQTQTEERLKRLEGGIAVDFDETDD